MAKRANKAAKFNADEIKRSHIHYSCRPQPIRVVEHPSRPEFLVTILEPRWQPGDRARLIDPWLAEQRPDVGFPEVVVERVEGPYTGRHSDRDDAYMYYVYEACRDVRYPTKGKSLEQVR